MRLSIENGNDFAGLNRLNGQFRIDHESRFGVTTNWNYFHERLSCGCTDETLIGDTNLTFRFAQNEVASLYAGLGFRMLSDRRQTEFRPHAPQGWLGLDSQGTALGGREGQVRPQSTLTSSCPRHRCTRRVQDGMPRFRRLYGRLPCASIMGHCRIPFLGRVVAAGASTCRLNALPD